MTDDWENISDGDSSPTVYPSSPEQKAVLYSSDSITMSDLKLTSPAITPPAKPAAALITPALEVKKTTPEPKRRTAARVPKTFPAAAPTVTTDRPPVTVLPVTSHTGVHPLAKSAPATSAAALAPIALSNGKRLLYVVEDAKTGRFSAVVQTEMEQANAALKALEDSVKSNPANLHKAIDALGLRISRYTLTREA